MISFQCPALYNHFARRLAPFKGLKKERKDMKRKENSNGWTETPFFPGDTHLGLLGRGFVSLLPAPPPFLPQGLFLQGS